MLIDLFNDKRMKVTDVNLKSPAPYYENKNADGSRRYRFNGTGWHELKFTVKFQAEDQYLFDAWITNHRFGKRFEFPMSRSANLKYRGSKTTAVFTMGSAIAGGRQITVTDAIEVGTRIQFSNHTKIYTITSYNAQTQTMSVFPNFREAVSAGETVHYSNPALTMVIVPSTLEQSLDQIVSVQLEAIEAM